MNQTVLFLVASLLVSGCTYSSSSTYEAADVGRTIETQQGSVVSSRIVRIKGGTSSAGPIAGGAIGAAGTGIAMGGHDASLWAALLGGVIGAGAGYLVEQQFGNREGIEYVVHMDDGRTVTLVQNRRDGEQPLDNGTPVLVQVGSKYSRVIQAPAGTPRRDGSGWVDPDSIGQVAPTSPSGGISGGAQALPVGASQQQ